MLFLGDFGSLLIKIHMPKKGNKKIDPRPISQKDFDRHAYLIKENMPAQVKLHFCWNCFENARSSDTLRSPQVPVNVFYSFGWSWSRLAETLRNCSWGAQEISWRSCKSRLPYDYGIQLCKGKKLLHTFFNLFRSSSFHLELVRRSPVSKKLTQKKRDHSW